MFNSKPLIIAYLDSWYIQNLSTFRTQDIQNTENLKIQFTQNHVQCWHICDPCTFKPWQIEGPGNTQKPVKHVWWAIFYRTLRNTSILGFWGIFRTLSNIYNGKFYSQTCVTSACSKSWDIQNQRHIQISITKFFIQNLV